MPVRLRFLSVLLCNIGLIRTREWGTFLSSVEHTHSTDTMHCLLKIATHFSYPFAYEVRVELVCPRDWNHGTLALCAITLNVKLDDTGGCIIMRITVQAGTVSASALCDVSSSKCSSIVKRRQRILNLMCYCAPDMRTDVFLNHTGMLSLRFILFHSINRANQL